tara:strand:- start:6222 stop:6755 length:534 start_codon:yes stop_codon:yes gene_type:complete
MKIGIMGAQSVGKTTLLNALRSEEAFNDYVICDEVTRDIRELGLEINEDGNDVTQMLIMQKHIVNVFLHDNMITDRTALDALVYTTHLNNIGKVSRNTLDAIKVMYDKCIQAYDFVFYISPEFDLVSDGVRSDDIDFRDNIVLLFEGFISEFPREVTILTGSVRGRVEQLMKTVGVV